MSAENGSMSVLLLRLQLAGAAALGLSPSDVLEKTGLPATSFDPKVLEDPDARVPARVVLRLWEVLPTLAGERRFGLWLADLAAGAPMTVAWWVVHASPTFAEGLSRAMRYQRLLHDGFRSELRSLPREPGAPSEGGAVVRHRLADASFRAPSAAIEFGFANVVHLARRGTGKPVVPVRVSLRHPAPAIASDDGDDAQLAHHHAIFGRNLEFDAEHDELAFDEATLALPMTGHDPALREVLEAHARGLLEKLPPEGAPVSTRVRGLLVEHLRGRATTLDAIAERLAMPRRTLQRKLREEGTRFEDLVDDVRKSLAVRYLRDPRVTVQETAFLLGFSDPSAFHRAFVRWTGETPARFRRGA